MWTTDFWGEFDRSFGALDELRRRMNALFQEPEYGRWLMPGAFDGDLATRQSWPRANFYDQGDDLIVEAMVPGLSEKDIQLSVTQDGLILAGERKLEAPEGYSVHRQERGGLRFSRGFSLPCRVDPEHASASVKNGILTIRMAKAKEAQPKQISVKASK